MRRGLVRDCMGYTTPAKFLHYRQHCSSPVGRSHHDLPCPLSNWDYIENDITEKSLNGNSQSDVDGAVERHVAGGHEGHANELNELTFFVKSIGPDRVDEHGTS